MTTRYLSTVVRWTLMALCVPALWALWGCSDDPLPTGNNLEEPVLPEGYEERDYQGMRYGLFVPPRYDPETAHPLIIRLHGSGDLTSWDLDWYHDPVQSSDPSFVLTPKSPGTLLGWGHGAVPTHSEAMQKTLEVVDLLMDEFTIDANRLYVYGASMGGFGVFSVLAKEPGIFAGAYAIAGGGDPATAEQVMQTPLWIFHGSQDTVVPVTESRQMYLALKNAGGLHVRYTEYAGVGHDSWTPAEAEPTLMSWLLAQEKGVAHSAPDTVESLNVEVIGEAQVRLAWNPPTNPANPDNQIWYYRIFRDDTLLAEVDTATTFVNSNLQAGSTYVYAVSAVNYFFEESDPTAPRTIQVPSGTTAAVHD